MVDPAAPPAAAVPAAGSPGWLSARTREVAGRVALYVIVVLFSLFAAMPFYIALIMSFKQSADLTPVANNPFIFNLNPTTSQWNYLFTQTPFGRFALNVRNITDETTLIFSTHKNKMRRDIEMVKKLRNMSFDEPSGLRLDVDSEPAKVWSAA